MQRFRFLLGAVIVAAGIGYLVLTGARQSSATHTTLAGLVASPGAAPAPRRVQLGGSTVVPGSIQWDEYRSRPVFLITDGAHTVRARYVGNAVLPDTFQDRAQVVLEGRYDAGAQTFLADVVYAKCPSKYEGQSYDDHLRSRGAS